MRRNEKQVLKFESIMTHCHEKCNWCRSRQDQWRLLEMRQILEKQIDSHAAAVKFFSFGFIPVVFVTITDVCTTDKLGDID